AEVCLPAPQREQREPMQQRSQRYPRQQSSSQAAGPSLPSKAYPGGNGSPSAHPAPSSKVSFFQIGTVFLSVSISQRLASKACARCAEATTIRTLVSPTWSSP